MLDLKPGDHHYKAYVGPVEKYDVVSAMQFNILTALGLRENHLLLDIGCGSLRAGRLIIPYLLPERYYGIEPNKWLVDEGIKNEIGNDLIKIKKPRFSFNSEFHIDYPIKNFDYAIAQSIFSHASYNQISECLKKVKEYLKEDGQFVATFMVGTEDYKGDEWVYPECVTFTINSIKKIGFENGFVTSQLNWFHPNDQTWFLFSAQKPLIENLELTNSFKRKKISLFLKIKHQLYKLRPIVKLYQKLRSIDS